VILQSTKASCKASCQLTGAEALLQNGNKVDSDDQQPPLDFAVIGKSSKYMTESANLADQVSRMALVHTILPGLLNNERIWIIPLP